MATEKVLVIVAGITRQIPDPDIANVGAGITSVAGLAVSAGNGAATIQPGTVLGTSGSGNINLPNNGAARFDIEGTAVSANVTAPNLGTLTAGPSSNADALHSHAGAANITVPGTSGEALAAGDLVAVRNNAGVPNIYKADGNGTQDLKNVIGTAASAVGASSAVSVVVSGEVSLADANWDAVPAATDVGSRAYLSTNAGKWTLTAPSASGDFTIRTGIVSRGGSGNVKAVIQIGEGVIN